MKFPTWTNPFLFEAMLGGICQLCSKFKQTFCKQIVDTLIRRRLKRRLIWFCTVCLCPTKRTRGLYWLSSRHLVELITVSQIHNEVILQFLKDMIIFIHWSSILLRQHFKPQLMISTLITQYFLFPIFHRPHYL